MKLNNWFRLNWRLQVVFARAAFGELRARLRREVADNRRAALQYVRASTAHGDAAAVLAALDDFGRHRRFLMNVGDKKGPLLKQMVAGLPDDARVLEIGAFVGYSAILISSTLGPRGRLVSLEYHPVAVEVARAMVEHAGLAERVDLREGKSQDLIPGLKEPFDMVFLDHWKDLYKPDLQALEQHGLLKPGCIVVADNVGPAFDPTEYLDYVRTCGRYRSRYEKSTIEYSRLEDGVEISIYQPDSSLAGIRST